MRSARGGGHSELHPLRIRVATYAPALYERTLQRFMKARTLLARAASAAHPCRDARYGAVRPHGLCSRELHPLRIRVATYATALYERTDSARASCIRCASVSRRTLQRYMNARYSAL